jgi:hypothetical protein
VTATAWKVLPVKILLINVLGSILVVVAHEPGPLSRRLAALRTWPSRKLDARQ